MGIFLQRGQKLAGNILASFIRSSTFVLLQWSIHCNFKHPRIINGQELIPPQRWQLKQRRTSPFRRNIAPLTREYLPDCILHTDFEKLRMHLKCIASNVGASTTIFPAWSCAASLFEKKMSRARPMALGARQWNTIASGETRYDNSSFYF